ncbi:ABC transporter permease subunit [Gordonia sp. VNK21]|uniref:ABC transporter permease subunit n=1 Tax=Gordonia sp. VNK21 TaxID=3382483 RepID=UPI0038D4D036
MTTQPVRSGRGGPAAALGAAIPLLFTALLFLAPLAALAHRAVTDADAVSAVTAWQRTDAWHLLAVTAGQAAASAALAVVVAAPIVWLTATVALPGALALRVLVTLPFVLPTVVVGVAFRALLNGPLAALPVDTGLGAVLLAHVFLNVAVVVRVVTGVWQQIDPQAMAAARSLGASRLRAFADVVAPRLLPAVAAAAALVFLFCTTSFGVIVILGDGKLSTLETEIYQLVVYRLRLALARLRVAVLAVRPPLARVARRLRVVPVAAVPRVAVALAVPPLPRPVAHGLARPGPDGPAERLVVGHRPVPGSRRPGVARVVVALLAAAVGPVPGLLLPPVPRGLAGPQARPAAGRRQRLAACDGGPVLGPLTVPPLVVVVNVVALGLAEPLGLHRLRDDYLEPELPALERQRLLLLVGLRPPRLVLLVPPAPPVAAVVRATLLQPLPGVGPPRL